MKIEDLKDFEFDNVSFSAKDISPYWFNEFPHEPIGVLNTHYSDYVDKTNTKDLEKHGWLNSDGSIKEITYRIYEYGFRTPLTSEPSAVFLGCSNTFGTALNEEQTYVYKVSKALNLPCVNLGIPGASFDHSYRILKTFLPVLNPKYIFCLVPQATRKEVYFDSTINSTNRAYGNMKSNIVKSFNLNTGGKKKRVDPLLNIIRLLQRYLLPTNEFQLTNYNRNLDAIKWLCKDYKFIYIPMSNYMNKREYGRARDLAHFGELWHDELTEDFLKKISE